MVSTILGWLIPWVIVAVGCWLVFELVRQNGRILLQLEAVNEQIGALGTRIAAHETAIQQAVIQQAAAPRPAAEPVPARGLPPGSPAPEFDLRDLAGGRKKLSDFKGKKLALIFFNPHCGFCTRMMPELAAVTNGTSASRPATIVVTNGSEEENWVLFKEHGVRCTVLLQEQMQVASLYQAQGTPMGYLIDEQGRIASPLGVGAEAVLAMARGDQAVGAPVSAPSSANGPDSNGNDSPASANGLVKRSLSESKIERQGLEAGTPAPDFKLPALGGGEISLKDFRGQPVALIFSDPHCGPCMGMAPHLEQFHRQNPGLKLLMVSRGDQEENQQKAQELGLTFPLALQRHWEVSRLYGMFATPVGYLINEDGVLESGAAVGAEPITAMLSAAKSIGSKMEAKSRK